MTHATKVQVTGFFQGKKCKASWEKDKGYRSYGNSDLIGEIVKEDAFPEPVGGTCYLESNTPEYAINVFYRTFDKVLDCKTNGDLEELPYEEGAIY